MIKECCNNCYACKVCDIHNEDDDLKITYCIGFIPKEELVRQDERQKFITLLKSDYENYKGIADEFITMQEDYGKYDSRTLEYFANERSKNINVANYIYSTIELLEKEELNEH